MRDIDEMDMPGYLQMRAWKAKQKADQNKPKRRYIDEVWGRMKPSVR